MLNRIRSEEQHEVFNKGDKFIAFIKVDIDKNDTLLSLSMKYNCTIIDISSLGKTRCAGLHHFEICSCWTILFQLIRFCSAQQVVVTYVLCEYSNKCKRCSRLIQEYEKTNQNNKSIHKTIENQSVGHARSTFRLQTLTM